MSFQRLVLGLVVVTVSFLEAFAAGDVGDGGRGANLAAYLRSQQPNRSMTNTATLVIRDSDARRQRIAVNIETVVNGANWIIRYRSISAGQPVTLSIGHAPDGVLTYECAAGGVTNSLPVNQVWGSFLGSDFWIADLGMEFLHWPQQRIIKQESSNGRLCDILESTNPSTNGLYATVRSAVDVEHKAILSAEAFDAQRRRVKQFAIKGAIELRGATIAGLIMTDDRKGSKSELVPDERREP